jgi:hypothetical protein
MLARDKPSSLLQTLIIYGCKMFFNIGPWRQKERINKDIECQCREFLLKGKVQYG